MNIRNYEAQVGLLLTVLPEVAKEDCFALHGGTAINLFIRNMPRLSVDIDLTYLPLKDRNVSIQAISKALKRIKKNIETTFSQFRVQHLEREAKLFISSSKASIKIGVNLTAIGRFAKGRFCEGARCEEAICERAICD